VAGKRSIFEEVAATARTAAPAAGGGLIARGSARGRRAVLAWLWTLFALVVLMIAVGGLTRLTDSGLAITEWAPVMGALPPLSAADWDAAFAAYRTTDEYRLVNAGMTLDEFRPLFWWEWGHRQLGRVIGLVWAAGFLGFLAARAVPPGWTGRLLLLGGLGGLQGAVGWWMVHSGLQPGRVDVASVRLAVHLGLAFAILGLIAWYAFALARGEAELIRARRAREARAFGLATGLAHLAFVQILFGALVAGIDAGRGYPTWPDMNGQFFPADAFHVPDGQGGSLPVWRAFLENAGLVQFVHRMTGYVLAAFAVVVWLRGRRSPHRATRAAFHTVLGLVALQVGLGIWAVLTAAALPVALAHQFGAVALWVAILRARHLAQYPLAGSIREGTA
jgi:cytochrome c oxidase assembly protein subunit 15